MIRPSFARLTITRLRYPTKTVHGTTEVDYYATPAEYPIDGCWLDPTQSIENNDSRTAVLTGYTVDAPAGIDLTSADRVRYGADTFEVDGSPVQIPSPSGALSSTRVILKFWKG